MLKRGLLLFIAILLVLISSSCFQNLADAPDTPDEQGETENTLRIVHFSFGGHWGRLPRSIEFFEDPVLEVEITKVDSFDETAYDQLRMEIISGDAPDLLLDANWAYPCNCTLISGLLMQDAFIKLDPYLEQWEKLDELTLYPSITNCIDTDGSCVLLPDWQYMSTLTTTKERMEQHGIELNQNPTIKEFTEQIEYYLSKNPDGLVFPMQLRFEWFLYLTGATSVFVDRQNRTSSFDSEEFRTLVECYELKAKARPRLGRAGHTFTPADTVNYENYVKLCFMQESGKQLSGQLVAYITAYFKIPKSAGKTQREWMLSGKKRPTKKPDADNIAKAILDSLNGIAYHDDSQIVELMVAKKYAEMPRVEVELFDEGE